MDYIKSGVFVLLIPLNLALFAPKANARLLPDSTDSLTVQSKKARFISASQPHIHEFSIWGGYAFDSFRLWGQTPDATSQFFGLRYNRKFLRFYNAELEYIFKISIYSNTYPEFKVGRPQNSLSGFGVVPLGFQLNFQHDKIVQPFINVTGGFVILNEPFPDQRGKKLNFTLSIGSGLEFILSPSVSLSLGLKYHHLSNGYRGKVNPGIDSSLFYTAITFF